jgi:5'-nucleotidase (lipoprotein e(P4) family)
MTSAAISFSWRKSVLLLILGLLLSCPQSYAQTNTTSSARWPDQALGEQNPLLYALAWKQTAAEYQALYHQGFNIARLHVQAALDKRQAGDKPLAVVTDVDDTIVHVLNYWGYLVNNGKDFFEDPLWDQWIAQNLITAAPGALDFLRFCADNNVEVFYVTSRDQGEPTLQIALSNLDHIAAPFVDETHVTVLRETSNKELRQHEIMQTHQVVVMLGDNLNDFRRKYYIRSDVEGRLQAMEEDRNLFGIEYILFPNPTDGHWLAAIFGDSEPEASAENRQLLQEAASRQAWPGP